MVDRPTADGLSLAVVVAHPDDDAYVVAWPERAAGTPMLADLFEGLF